MPDRVAIVTGAAAGIGLATARRLLGEGGKVLLADVNEAALHDAAAELTAAFGAAAVASAVCDVSDEPACAAAVAAALQAFGAVNVIVNNAGLMVFKTIETQSREDWLRVLSVDLLGAVYFTKQAFLHMGQGGAIVNVASVHAVQTEPMVAPYAAAKAALLSLTRSAVLPGAIDTPMLWDNPNVRAGIEQVDPRDVGRPEDVAAVIAFLAGADAAFMNGAAVLVDGGRLVRL